MINIADIYVLPFIFFYITILLELDAYIEDKIKECYFEAYLKNHLTLQNPPL